MKKTKNLKLKSVLVLLLVGAICILPGVFAFADDSNLVIECESNPYTAVKGDGQTKWTPKAASTDLTKVDGSNTKGLVFTNGTVGAKISYTFSSNLEGEYDFYFAARPNENYFCDVNVYLNGNKLNSQPITFRKNVTVLGANNYDNKVRDYNLGKTELIKGENTVFFEVVESNPSPTSVTLVLDSFGFNKSGESGSAPEVTPGGSLLNNMIKYEGESTPFSTTDSTGKVSSTYVKDDPNNNAWAWNLNLANVVSSSGSVAFFRSGGVGGTVDYKPTVEKAGKYGLVIAYRPGSESYSTIEVLVNGKKIGGEVSHKTGVTVGGVVNNASSIVRELVMGNADFTAGENTVTFKIVGAGANEIDTAFTVDYFGIGDVVDESKLTFTEKMPENPAIADKNNSMPATTEIPEGMLDSYAGISAKPQTTDKITVYPEIPCYEKNIDYKLTADGASVPVYKISAGKAYAANDYSYASFAYDSSKGEIKLTVECEKAVKKLDISPMRLGIKAEIDGKKITFTIDKAQNYALCINSSYLVISADPMEKDVPMSEGTGIFNITKAPYSVSPSMSDKEVTEAIQKALDDASAYGSTAGNKNGVVYIPAGVYYVGNLVLSSNTYMYLEGGALLRITDDTSLLKINGTKTSMTDPNGKRGVDFTWWISTWFEETLTENADGSVSASVEGSYDIKIGGRGTIDGRDAHFWNTSEEGNHSIGANTVVPIAVSHFIMEDIIIRDAVCWSVVAVRSDNLTLDNLKNFNVTKRHHDENDGIDLCECQDSVVKNCIGFAMDDPFSAKTWPYKTGITLNWPGYPEYSSNVTFDNCMSYTQRMGFKIGQGTDQCHYDVKFINCTVIDATMGIGIHCSSGSGIVYNPTFENIYIEKLHAGGFYQGCSWLYLNVQANSRGNGNIRDITIKNIYVNDGAEGTSKVTITAISSQNAIKGVYLTDIYFDGVRAKNLDDIKPGINRNGYVYNLSLVESTFPDSSKDDENNNESENPSEPQNPADDNNTDGKKKNTLLPFLIIGACAIPPIAICVIFVVVLLRRKRYEKS